MGPGIKLDQGWQKYLSSELKADYMLELFKFLQSETKNKKIIFPTTDNIFLALNLTPLDKVKVVILGQDPYHGAGQAHGLAFSVPEGITHPPSLRNIFQELKEDLNIEIPKNGNLTAWANEGVLLLNTILTVEEGKAASHHGKGWEKFTDKIISIISEHNKHVVFILWGSNAHIKEALIDSKKHCILKSVHPSPLSSYRGFFGSRPFSKSNSYLKLHGIKPLSWKL